MRLLRIILKRIILNMIIVLNVIALIENNSYRIKAFVYRGSINNIGINISTSGGIWGQLVAPWEDEWNLDNWTQEQLTQNIPDDQLFSYKGLVYIKNPGRDYIPAWHGMPGEQSSRWAVFALDLNWVPNTNYRSNSVVIRNGKYYITNNNFNNNWFIDDPAHNRNEWLEIKPISEEHFEYFPGTNLRDYAKPDFKYIIYK